MVLTKDSTCTSAPPGVRRGAGAAPGVAPRAEPGSWSRRRGAGLRGAGLRRSGAVALVAVVLTAHRDPPHPGDVHQARHELAERRTAVEAGRDAHQGPAVLVDEAGADGGRGTPTGRG